MQRANLLIEITTEELPATKLANIINLFESSIKEQLEKNGFDFTNIQSFATPRRIALLIKNIVLFAKDKQLQIKGPSKKICFDENNELTKVGLKWANSQEISKNQIKILTAKKGDYVYFDKLQQGISLKKILESILIKSLNSLQIFNFMRWGDGNFEFIRPVCNLVVLLDKEVLAINLFEKNATNILQGHRNKDNLPLDKPENYEKILEQINVVASFSKRKEIIKTKANEISQKLGLVIELEDDFLNEIVSLVEYPNILLGEFSAKFLEIPKEALIYTLKINQKYICIFNQDKTLTNKFLFVSNIKPKNEELIIKGNQKVVNARLEDALFFFNLDKKQDFLNNFASLKKLFFSKELGSFYDKVLRVEEIALFFQEKFQVTKLQIQQTTKVFKNDLLTNLVLEFPALEGLIGANYAKHFGLDESTANCIKEHYLPRFAKDELPKTSLGKLFALCDKIDTLVGFFILKKAPTGTKDPFAIRRNALAIIRILEQETIELKQLIKQSVNNFSFLNFTNQEIIESEIFNFFKKRLEVFYKEKGYKLEVIQATIETSSSIFIINKKIKVLTKFVLDNRLTEFLAIYKRCKNILLKNKIAKTKIKKSTENCDQKLQTELDLANKKINKLVKTNDYQQVLTDILLLASNVKIYFDQVMILSDNRDIREYRLNLVQDLFDLFNLEFNFSKIT